MSVTALRPEAPLQLLHPLWCGLGPSCADGASPTHRVTHTHWEVPDVVFTFGQIRWDEPRYLNDQRHEVDGRGEPAPEPGEERVEMTMTDTAGIVNGSHPCLTVAFNKGELRMFLAAGQQELERLESGPFPRDYTRDNLEEV